MMLSKKQPGNSSRAASLRRKVQPGASSEALLSCFPRCLWRLCLKIGSNAVNGAWMRRATSHVQDLAFLVRIIESSLPTSSRSPLPVSLCPRPNSRNSYSRCARNTPPPEDASRVVEVENPLSVVCHARPSADRHACMHKVPHSMWRFKRARCSYCPGAYSGASGSNRRSP